MAVTYGSQQLCWCAVSSLLQCPLGLASPHVELLGFHYENVLCTGVKMLLCMSCIILPAYAFRALVARQLRSDLSVELLMPSLTAGGDVHTCTALLVVDIKV